MYKNSSNMKTTVSIKNACAARFFTKRTPLVSVMKQDRVRMKNSRRLVFDVNYTLFEQKVLLLITWSTHTLCALRFFIGWTTFSLHCVICQWLSSFTIKLVIQIGSSSECIRKSTSDVGLQLHVWTLYTVRMVDCGLSCWKAKIAVLVYRPGSTRVEFAASTQPVRRSSSGNYQNST